jgi:hypothetical protein
MNILGCEVSISTFEAWSEIFVFEREPLFLNIATRETLPSSISRTELKCSLEFADAYLTYLIPKTAEFVASLKPEEFRSLPRGHSKKR